MYVNLIAISNLTQIFQFNKLCYKNMPFLVYLQNTTGIWPQNVCNIWLINCSVYIHMYNPIMQKAITKWGAYISSGTVERWQKRDRVIRHKLPIKLYTTRPCVPIWESVKRVAGKSRVHAYAYVLWCVGVFRALSTQASYVSKTA